MKINSYKSRKNSLSAWVLSMALLLGLSLFSGYGGKSTTRQQPLAEQECRYINNHKAAKRSASYQNAVANLSKGKVYNNADVYGDAVSAYNKIIKVKLLHTCSVFNASKPANRYIYITTLHKNSEEDIFIVIKG